MKKLTTEEFIQKANKVHNNKYNYSKTIYQNSYTKIKIVCPIHGSFFQKPADHLQGQGCPTCGNNVQRSNIKEFIIKAQKIHKNAYDYSLVNYINNKTKVELICKKCGKHFLQRPDNHIGLKQGCPYCKESKGEKQIKNYLIEHNIKFEREKRFEGIKRKPFDFYIPYLNIAIEYNGKQHYKSVEKFGGEKQLKIQQEIDKSKEEYCKQNNINLYIIKYTEKIEKRLKEILNIT